jgi:hypothetical protein
VAAGASGNAPGAAGGGSGRWSSASAGTGARGPDPRLAEELLG